MTLQNFPTITPELTASEPLMPAKVLETHHKQPKTPVVLSEPKDTTGQAKLRDRAAKRAAADAPVPSTSKAPEVEQSTEWNADQHDRDEQRSLVTDCLIN